MKKTEYRCSSCDKVKSEKNQVYKDWCKEGDVVAICHECNNFMKAYNVEYVDNITDLINYVKHLIKS